MKVRVIPSILTDGVCQVKGQRFDNWRTVGSVVQAVRVQSRRDVDEIVLLDVNASKQGRMMSTHLVTDVANFLRIPLAVGGGITSVEDVSKLLAAGADKVVIGSSAVTDSELVANLSREFGSQAIVVAIDAVAAERSEAVARLSGTKHVGIHPREMALKMECQGAGEILLQNVDRDGTLEGLNISLIREVCGFVSVPVLASSGLNSAENAVSAVKAGASAIVAGAILQFTEVTPATIKLALSDAGFDVRR